MTPLERASAAMLDVSPSGAQWTLRQLLLSNAKIGWNPTDLELAGQVESLARAVIQAIREPNAGMIDAAVRKAGEIGPHDHVGIFRAMIDAMLEAEPERP